VIRSRTGGPRREAAGEGEADPRPADPQVPFFEELPVFEEAGSSRFQPGPVARVALDGSSAPGRQLGLLAARVRALGRDKRLRRLGVVGSSPGEGSSTVALGLAGALARDHALRILLLELDLRRPSLDEHLGLPPPAIGLRAYLSGASDTPVLRRDGPHGFWLLSAGGEGSSRRPTLSSPRLATLLRSADRVFDYVVADCPPVLAGGDVTAAQGVLDGLILVVRSRHSPRETIRRASSALRAELLLGLVLNAQRDILPRPASPQHP
jgi:Mrp family chromosome partitioning ATPase